MLQWISENVGTILICMGLIVIVALIVRSLIRQKKQGKSPAGPDAPTAPCTVSAIRTDGRRKCHKGRDTEAPRVPSLLLSPVCCGRPSRRKTMEWGRRGPFPRERPSADSNKGAPRLQAAQHGPQTADKRRDPYGPRLFAYAVMPCGRWSCVGRFSLIPGASCPPAEPHRPWP